MAQRTDISEDIILFNSINSNPSNTKYALFGVEWVIIRPRKGSYPGQYETSDYDIEILPNRIEKLREVEREGYSIILIENINFDDFNINRMNQLSNILVNQDINFELILLRTGSSSAKPNKYIWDVWTGWYPNTIEDIYYIGDGYTRNNSYKGDNDVDKKFCMNINVKFISETHFFPKTKPFVDDKLVVLIFGSPRSDSFYYYDKYYKSNDFVYQSVATDSDVDKLNQYVVDNTNRLFVEFNVNDYEIRSGYKQWFESAGYKTVTLWNVIDSYRLNPFYVEPISIDLIDNYYKTMVFPRPDENVVQVYPSLYMDILSQDVLSPEKSLIELPDLPKHTRASTVSQIQKNLTLDLFEKNGVKTDLFYQLRLTPEEIEIWDSNPHIRQSIINNKLLKFHNDYNAIHYADGQITIKDLLIDDDSKTLDYHRDKGLAKTVEHRGQRKLLISEMEMLNLYISYNDSVVVYAGASPGHHINYLIQRYPNIVHWILIDPRPSAVKTTDGAVTIYDLKNQEKTKVPVTIIQEFFTDEIATKIRSSFTSNIIFISDIRHLEGSETFEEKEESIRIDMENQSKWIKILNPIVSLLKFRLPFHLDEFTSYYDGIRFFQTWGGVTTSESRLLVSDYTKTRWYDNMTYSDVMSYFNNIGRVSYFDQDLGQYENEFRSLGYDHCFDCSSELFVLETYVKSILGNVDQNRILTNVLQLAKLIKSY